MAAIELDDIDRALLRELVADAGPPWRTWRRQPACRCRRCSLRCGGWRRAA